MADDERIRKFHAVWPELVKTITESPMFLDVKYSSVWFKCVLENNVPLGKQNRWVSYV
jgi:hypothetical protein